MLKSLWRSRALQSALGLLIASYFKLLRLTTTFVIDRPEGYEDIDRHWPVIVTSWHGQHLMMPFLKRPKDRVAVLVSNHGDGRIAGYVAARFDMELVHGSGGHRAHQIRKRGGAKALRALVQATRRNLTIAMTADVPKVSRVASAGLVLMAQMSGRPILPVAMAVKNRIDLKSWDRASIGLPLFNRGVIAFGEPIFVPGDADAAQREAKRIELELVLDRLQARAYAHFGQADPGAGRASVEAARAAQRQTASAGAVEPGEEGSLGEAG